MAIAILFPGCKGKRPEILDRSLPDDVAVVYLRRDLPSGDFKGYRSPNRQAVKAVWDALRDDARGHSQGHFTETACSVDHVVYFVSSSGDEWARYYIQGDARALFGGYMYSAAHTLPVLDRFLSTGAMEPMSPEETRPFNYEEAP